jgi:hypothetical protein
VFWCFFAKHAPAVDASEARKRDARILVQALIASAARFARGGYEAVVDYSIAPGPWTRSALGSRTSDRLRRARARRRAPTDVRRAPRLRSATTRHCARSTVHSRNAARTKGHAIRDNAAFDDIMSMLGEARRGPRSAGSTASHDVDVKRR